MAAEGHGGGWPAWAVALAPIEPLFRATVAVRCALYDAGWLRVHRAPVPVISVGNLTVGGSGKSPMVAWVARTLARSGHRPAVVSRGHGGSHAARATVVSDGGGPLLEADVAGDEPVMLAMALPGVPVIVSRRRADGAELAVSRFSSSCVILDDGFQHRALARDLDLVMMDAHDPLGTGRLLPAGLLREPPAALRRASAVVVHSSGAPSASQTDARRRIGETVSRHCPRAPVLHARSRAACLVHAATGRKEPPGMLASLPVACFAGIAHPDRFFEEVRRAGADVRWSRPFPDHHPFTAADLDEVAAASMESGAAMILTTEKDLARLGRAGASRLPDLHALRMALEVEEAAALERLLLEAVA